MLAQPRHERPRPGQPFAGGRVAAADEHEQTGGAHMGRHLGYPGQLVGLSQAGVPLAGQVERGDLQVPQLCRVERPLDPSVARPLGAPPRPGQRLLDVAGLERDRGDVEQHPHLDVDVARSPGPFERLVEPAPDDIGGCVGAGPHLGHGRVRPRAVQAQGVGGRERLVGGGIAFRHAADRVAHASVGGRRPGAHLAGGLGRHQSHGGAALPVRAGVVLDAHQGLRKRVVDPRPRSRIGVRPQIFRRCPQQCHRPVQLAAAARHGSGLEQQRHLVAAGALGGVRNRRPQRQGGLQVLQLLGRRPQRARVPGRLESGTERARQVVALAGMVSALGCRAGAGCRGEVTGDRCVQPHPFPGQQVGEDRLAQQGVPEAVAPIGRDDQQVMVHRLGQSRLEAAGGQPSHRGDELVPHPSSGHGGDPQHLLRCRRPLLDTRQQHVGEAQRQRLAVQPRREQFLGEERVALGTGHDVVDRRLGQACVGPGEPADERADRGIGQRCQFDALDSGKADELGEQRPQRVPAVQVVGAVGRDEGDGIVDETGQQVAQQVAAGPIGPVHVLQHDEQRLRRGELAEQRGDGLEQLEPPVVDRLRRGPVRQRTVQLARRRHRRRPGSATGQETGQRRVPR